ncbi:hypothetical protein N0V83_003349 [Neocucurbitaria cava]|uniref:Uncharacterized protein n=1 Tax=Neocucurbitaria cava TaxID=798079 RepID=A0A9W8YDW5_9PLEO|nr:hypothetical protein N0V83_003349 [Neocucurbitaria cava]
MHFSTILLGFAAAATAIDVRMYDNGNCGGGFYEWKNVDPKVCCARNNDHHSSAEWRAIPTNWHLNVGAYRQNNCEVLVASRDTNDQASVCLTGARYHFRDTKRAEQDSCDAPGASEEVQQQCEQQVPPSRVGLADGSLYNIVGLETDMVDTLIDFAYNGSSAADVPEVYAKLVVVE